MLIIFLMKYHSGAPVDEQNDQRSESDFVLDDYRTNSEDRQEDTDEEVEAKKDDGWLARIVPEFEFPDLFKPVQLQIPIITFPKLPSYSISIAR